MSKGTINKVILVGRLGQDPEVRYMPSGKAVANISVATNDGYKDKQTGQFVDQTEWHRIALFGRLGEIAGQYLKKGSLVYVEGRLQTRKWTDKNGQDRYSTEIVANEMQLLGRKEGEGGGDSYTPFTAAQGPAQAGGPPAAPMSSPEAAPLESFAEEFDDDIPF